MVGCNRLCEFRNHRSGGPGGADNKKCSATERVPAHLGSAEEEDRSRNIVTSDDSGVSVDPKDAIRLSESESRGPNTSGSSCQALPHRCRLMIASTIVRASETGLPFRPVRRGSMPPIREYRVSRSGGKRDMDTHAQRATCMSVRHVVPWTTVVEAAPGRCASVYGPARRLCSRIGCKQRPGPSSTSAT